MEKYLPIGTIVNLSSNSKKVMIVGYYSLEYQNVVKIFDYVGCIYPEGMLLKNSLISFNHTDITKVVNIGYKDDNFHILNNNLTSQQKLEKTELKSNNNFVNLKFDENGVVLYDELSDTKQAPQIISSKEAKNPFKEAKNSDKGIKKVAPKFENEFKFDENGIVVEDNTLTENIKEIESNFKYVFDENGVVVGEENIVGNNSLSQVKYTFSPDGTVIEEQSLELPKEKDNNKVEYVFDENGMVVGEKSNETKANYQFNEDGIVISE